MWFLDNLTITFDHDLCLRFCLIPPRPHDRQTFSYKTLNNDVCAASHRWRPHDPHQVHRGEFIRSPKLCWLQDEPSGVAGRGINLRWCNGHSGISNLSGRFYSGWDLSGFGGDKVTAAGAFQLLALCARWHWRICPGPRVLFLLCAMWNGTWPMQLTERERVHCWENGSASDMTRKQDVTACRQTVENKVVS